MSSKITVLKFGSSVLRDEADLPRAVHEIYRHWRHGSQVLVVVSAIGQTTDELLRRAENLASEPHAQSVATLLATGETTSASLLGIALHRSGLPVKVFDAGQVHLRTTGNALDAEPISVDADKLREHLATSIVVVPGFVGVSDSGDTTLLGRGGSDLTALFLAERLEAHAVLIKDVHGLYESDPNVGDKRPRRFARASWETALRVGHQVVQDKAVRFARDRGVNFSITACGSRHSTVIDNGQDELVFDRPESPALRVALLGCGTVGGGVFRALAALPEFFEIVAVADRNWKKAASVGVPDRVFTDDATAAIERDCDVVIELFGGIEPTRSYIERALDLGRHVVTANKALLAQEVDRLEYLAERRSVTLRYSAAVGGVMPALEAVSRTSGIRRFSGIVNGTCNFICDELIKGTDFSDAVCAAQAAGFAEADPTLDISGTDAAQKLSLLARSAFGIRLSADDIAVEGVTALDASLATDATARGNVIRLIAECNKTNDGFEASVRPMELSSSHPFALAKGAENRLILETTDGKTTVLSGRGAGRWPTTEAIVADLFDLHRETTSDVQRYAVATAASQLTEVYA